MKTIVIHFFLFFFIYNVNAQNDEYPLPFAQQEPAYDTAPRFPGGSDAMMKYFEDSVRYPEPEKSKHIHGNVSMKFVVTKKGKTTNVVVVNGVPGGPNLATEAIRLIESSPAWIPANKNGKPVEAEYFLSVPFKINREQY